MRPVSVTTDLAGLGRIISSLAEGLQDARPLWDRLERVELKATQGSLAAANWGPRPLWRQGRALSPKTKENRQRRRRYYKNKPTGDATLSTRLLWTGHLRDATARFSTKGKDRAEIDTAQTYRGPIKGYADPVQEIVADRHGGTVWQLPRIDRAIGETALEWWADHVIRRAT